MQSWPRRSWRRALAVGSLPCWRPQPLLTLLPRYRQPHQPPAWATPFGTSRDPLHTGRRRSRNLLLLVPSLASPYHPHRRLAPLKTDRRIPPRRRLALLVLCPQERQKGPRAQPGSRQAAQGGRGQLDRRAEDVARARPRVGGGHQCGKAGRDDVGIDSDTHSASLGTRAGARRLSSSACAADHQRRPSRTTPSACRPRTDSVRSPALRLAFHSQPRRLGL